MMKAEHQRSRLTINPKIAQSLSFLIIKKDMTRNTFINYSVDISCDIDSFLIKSLYIISPNCITFHLVFATLFSHTHCSTNTHIDPKLVDLFSVFILSKYLTPILLDRLFRSFLLVFVCRKSVVSTASFIIYHLTA